MSISFPAAAASAAVHPTTASATAAICAAAALAAAATNATAALAAAASTRTDSTITLTSAGIAVARLVRANLPPCAGHRRVLGL